MRWAGAWTGGAITPAQAPCEITETVLGVLPMVPDGLYELRHREDGGVEVVRLEYGRRTRGGYWDGLTRL